MQRLQPLILNRCQLLHHFQTLSQLQRPSHCPNLHQIQILNHYQHLRHCRSPSLHQLLNRSQFQRLQQRLGQFELLMSISTDIAEP